MKRNKISLIITAIFLAAFIGACGEGNGDSPYNASDGMRIEASTGGTFESGGGAFLVNFPVKVIGSDGYPVNDVNMRVLIMVGMTVSSWAVFYHPDLELKDFVGDSDELSGWDSELGTDVPVYTTGNNGVADVNISVPFGFAGTIGLSFDIGADQADAEIVVSPVGGQCFNGKEDEVAPATPDGFIDAQDPDCAGIDGTEY